MHPVSRRAILKAGLGAMPAMAAAQPLAAFGQTCGASTPGQACLPATPTSTTLRQVATGCHVPDTEYPGVASVAFRSPHFNRSGVTLKSLQIVVPNRYGLSVPRSPKTWRARIEYPINVTTEVTWNCGAADVTTENPPANSRPYIVSDTITLQQPIPDNALFWVRLWQQDLSASALLCQNIGNYSWDPQHPIGSVPRRTVNFALGETNSPGDWSLLANPVLQDPAHNNRWTFTDGGGGLYSGATDWVGLRPLAILGQSRKPAFSLWGDSRVCGVGDAFDGTSDDRGEVERSIGPDYAYINLAVPGQQAAGLASLFQQVMDPTYNPWLYFRNYTTNMIENLGGADCLPLGQSRVITSGELDVIWANKNSIWSGWMGTTSSGLKGVPTFSTLTVPPYTNPEWAFGNDSLKLLTDKIRFGASIGGTSVRVLDVASIIALVRSEKYVWSCDDYAADTLHESQAGCYAIHDSGIIDPSVLTR